MAKTYLATQAYVDDALRRNGRHYTVRWDKSFPQLERLNDAAGITTNTANFGHFGAVNPNYDNPFDKIYPWSGRRLCNIDVNLYRALRSGDSIRDCVVAWEGDPDFSYTHTYGVWVYTPEFWGRSWDDGSYRYFDITDKPLGGYIYYRERIEGRWHGCQSTLTIDGTEKQCLLPVSGGTPSIASGVTNHTYAKNYGATVDTVFSRDANIMMFIVEYATMDSQSVIGSGYTSSTNVSMTPNSADSEIGSASGYIGTNGKTIAYYRGEELYGNAQFYTLGFYHRKTDRHVFIAKEERDCVDVDVLDTSVHIDTGCVTPNIYSIMFRSLYAMPDMTSVAILTAQQDGAPDPGHTSVGDSILFGSGTTGVAVLYSGGLHTLSAECGIFATYLLVSKDDSTAAVGTSARPCLLKPYETVTEVAL